MASSQVNVIRDEADVPTYTLPDVLTLPDGQVVTDTETWKQQARPALLDLFARYQYGKTPGNPVIVSVGDSADDSNIPGFGRGQWPKDAVIMMVENESLSSVFQGKAQLIQARLRFELEGRSAAFNAAVLIPSAATEPAPVLIGLNFWGNHTIDPLTALRLSPEIPGMEPKERGSHAHRWNLEELIDAGYAVATAFRGEIAPDHPEHYGAGILQLFDQSSEDAPMGAIGTWSWSLSRLLDYVSVLPQIDSARATVFGHSRLGKASLWAGAQDERFAEVIANNSGCLGAALSRREFGETVGLISRGYPYWFTPKVAEFGDNVEALPVDQHQLLALIAPRPIRLGGAERDYWADPRGELLALREALKVYQLFGVEESLPDQLPAIGSAYGEHVRFHLRAGNHDITLEDWTLYLPGMAN